MLFSEHQKVLTNYSNNLAYSNIDDQKYVLHNTLVQRHWPTWFQHQ
tara:strand:+ start:593 stop:730 length:138 start_codon:yes stop_codon:yes gene_type:complete